MVGPAARLIEKRGRFRRVEGGPVRRDRTHNPFGRRHTLDYFGDSRVLFAKEFVLQSIRFVLYISVFAVG